MTELPPSLWPTLHRLTTADAWPPSSAAAAAAFVAEAGRHGLLPLLFEADAPPAAVADALGASRGWRRVLEARSSVLEAGLVRVAGLLGGEAWLALKGAEYRHRLYPRPWLRPMQDLDVLVPYARMDAVGERLSAAGFVQGFPGGAVTRVASHHERVFVAGDVVVEVHHSFVQRPRHRVDYESVWARRVGLETPALRAARLDDADAFLLHAMGLAVDAFAVPLLRYVDLWLMLRRSPDVVGTAAARAREWQARHALYGTLRQLVALFPEARTPEVDAAARALVGRGSRAWLDRFVLPRALGRRRERDVGRLARLWRKYWLLDNLGRRVAFAAGHAYALWAGARLARRATSTNPSVQ